MTPTSPHPAPAARSEENRAEFNASIHKTDGHWLWIADTFGGSSPRPTWRSIKGRRAPRYFSYELHHGFMLELERRECLGPACGELLCVNPVHLEVWPLRDWHAHLRAMRGPTTVKALNPASRPANSMLEAARMEAQVAAEFDGRWPGTCVYCGWFAEARDHLLPRAWTGESIRTVTPTVPACNDCNGALSDHLEPLLAARAVYAGGVLDRRWKDASLPRWSPDDLAELEGTLRRHVESKHRRAEIRRARLEVLANGGAIEVGGVPTSFRREFAA